MGSAVAVAALCLGLAQGSLVPAQDASTPFQVSAFEQLQIEGAGHAIISIGPRASVTVEGPANEISNLHMQVWFNALEIEPNDDDNNSPSGDLIYHITVPSLSQIELEGNVSAELDVLTVDSLEISLQDNASRWLTKLSTQRLESKVEGNATVSVSGAAGSQQLEIENNGTFDSLQANRSSIDIQAKDHGYSKFGFTDDLSRQIDDQAIDEYMTESGGVLVSTEDGGQVTQLAFEALAA